MRSFTSQHSEQNKSSCYQPRLAAGQTPLPNRNKHIRATQAIPAAFARSLLLKSTCRTPKARFSVLQRKQSHFIRNHSSESPLRKQAVFYQAKICLSKCVHITWGSCFLTKDTTSQQVRTGASANCEKPEGMAVFTFVTY